MTTAAGYPERPRLGVCETSGVFNELRSTHIRDAHLEGRRIDVRCVRQRVRPGIAAHRRSAWCAAVASVLLANATSGTYAAARQRDTFIACCIGSTRCRRATR